LILFFWFVLIFSVLFFFQAEDGIRDRNVTGVQTCALPILLKMLRSSLQLVLTSLLVVLVTSTVYTQQTGKASSSTVLRKLLKQFLTLHLYFTVVQGFLKTKLRRLLSLVLLRSTSTLNSN